MFLLVLQVLLLFFLLKVHSVQQHSHYRDKRSRAVGSGQNVIHGKTGLTYYRTRFLSSL